MEILNIDGIKYCQEQLAENKSGEKIQKIKYTDLVELRNNSKLIPGQLYRITDYVCPEEQPGDLGGKKFDVIVMAITENKLSERGLADYGIPAVYNVTFSDDTTPTKCYLYSDSAKNVYNIVDINSLLGQSVSSNEIQINENNKTASCTQNKNLSTSELQYTDLSEYNVTAWDIKYCLDNDTTRFAWADDSVDESVAESITCYGRTNYGKTNTFIYERNPSIDIDAAGEYGWSCNENGTPTQNLYTATLTIIPGTTKAADSPGGRPSYNIGGYTPAHEGTNLPNGRGVVYSIKAEDGLELIHENELISH